MAAPAVTPLDVEMLTCPSTPLQDLIYWLQEIGLLATSMTCVRCPNVDMEWQERRDVGDRHSWRCPNCRTSKSIREGSVFADFPKISLPIWMRFLLQWAEDKLVKDMKAELAPVGNISKCTLYRMCRLLWTICERKLFHGPSSSSGPTKTLTVALRLVGKLAEIVLNWHKATDGRGLDQRTRRQYNLDMLAFLLED
ncbi:hypothetical protein Bbelb_050650 [Branchiostoma belcheri]|nr:hypothetical protein Bbelb_050650 [Branchiostoma belcheri]